MTDLRFVFAPFLYFGRVTAVGTSGSLAGPTLDNCFALFLVIDGTLRLSGAGGDWDLRPDQASLVGPGTTVDQVRGTRYLHLAFDLTWRQRRLGAGRNYMPQRWEPQPAWETLFGLPLPPRIDPDFLRTRTVALHRLTHARVYTARGQMAAHADLARLVVDYLEFLERPQRAPARSRGGGGSPADPGELLALVDEVILTRYRLGVTVAEVADHLGYSADHLTRVYRAYRSRPPSAFIRRCRVEQACAIMREHPTRDLDAVAREVGLAGASSLNRCFHRELGMSPSAWRRHGNDGV